MRKSVGFSFKWKLVENYVAAAFGGVFLWLFVTGIVDSNPLNFWASIVLLAVAPFLVTFIDKKSSGA